MQRIGLIAILAVAAYFLVMAIMPPEEDGSAENPLARPAASEKPMMDMDSMADKMSAPKMSKEAETRKLLAELRTIPVSEYAVNLEKYERLLELHPGDKTFLHKVAFYSQRINQQRSAVGY